VKRYIIENKLLPIEQYTCLHTCTYLLVICDEELWKLGRHDVINQVIN